MFANTQCAVKNSSKRRDKCSNSAITTVTAAAPVGRSLIRYTNGNHIWFERVYSELDTTASTYAALEPATVGQRILPPAGTDALVG